MVFFSARIHSFISQFHLCIYDIYTGVFTHYILVSTIETKIIGRHCICGEQGWIKKYCGLNIKVYGDHYWPPQEQIEATLNKKSMTN